MVELIKLIKLNDRAKVYHEIILKNHRELNASFCRNSGFSGHVFFLSTAGITMFFVQMVSKASFFLPFFRAHIEIGRIAEVGLLEPVHFVCLEK